MGKFPEYDQYDAVGLAGLVRDKRIHPREILDEALERCDRVNPKLNAIICRLDAQAKKAVDSVDLALPLAGVPFLAKDLGPPLAGAPLTSGSKLFANYVPEEDGELIKRFKAAGLIFFGKTNVPEFGLVPVTEPELFGPCRNPWDLGRTTGGSSGGSAAAVAAGIVPMAHASDGGGSIRIPSSCCGVFGLKTSRGLNPKDISVETVAEDFGVDHVVSRSVRDSAAALDAISNRINPGFLSGLEREPGRLRIAVTRSAMLGNKVAPEVQEALAHAVKLLEGLGHTVEDAETGVNYGEFRNAFLTYWAINALQLIHAAAQTVGRKLKKGDVELPTWALSIAGRAMTAADRERAKNTIAHATRVFEEFLQRYDIILSPVLATLPIHIGENRVKSSEAFAINFADTMKWPWVMKALLKAVAARSFDFAAFTTPFNMTGQPAISVPLYWTQDGLPVGIQFGAKQGADALLLRLARQLEIAAPWSGRKPPIWSGERVREAA